MRERNREFTRTGVATAGLIILLIGCVVVTPFVRKHLQERNQHERRLHLFRAASGMPPDWQGSEDEARAVHELGADNSDEAERMLIDLAAHTPQFPSLNAQQEAIRELAKRKDPNVGTLLAGFIQTGTLLDSRRSAAKALQFVPCNVQCTEGLLDYLNKIDTGELNLEDRDPPDFGTALTKTVSAMTKKQQEEIYNLIYAVLLRSPATTNEVLANKYGFGTSTPKPFAIDFANRTNSANFCPLLIRSGQELARVKSDLTLLAEVEKSSKSLNCPVP